MKRVVKRMSEYTLGENGDLLLVPPMTGRAKLAREIFVANV